ncbi:hypothetical protein, partial [Romboutsia sp.]|uniref:hypothetical protein n=1 Tax=Romboutsia sp. TaxID=1965302 RepID=UPI002B9C9A78
MKISIAFIPIVTGQYKELIDHRHIYISDKGMLYNKKTNKMLSTSLDKYGYERVSIGGKSYLVHRLVALVYVQNYNEENRIVCHKNKDRADNRAINLMWSNNNFINIRRSDFSTPNKGKMIIGFKEDKCMGVFASGGQAERELDLNRSEIYRCCKGERRTTGGYSFKYYEDVVSHSGKYM